MKTINIYITKQQQKKANEVRIKYKVSLSTLCGIITFELVKALMHYSLDQRNYERLTNEYLNKNGTYKTSVKPREVMETLQDIKNKNTITTNALIIYLEHDISKYVNQDGCNKYWANIDKKLKNAYDIYWDYNCSIRNQRRMIRQNKDYWKKALED